MNLQAINSLSNYSTYNLDTNSTKKTNNEAFETLFQSALDMVNETNQLTNAAEEAELSFAMGLTDSTTDLSIAQAKATTALQYTVAVRNAVLDAYKEIMQLSF